MEGAQLPASRLESEMQLSWMRQEPVVDHHDVPELLVPGGGGDGDGGDEYVWVSCR